MEEGEQSPFFNMKAKYTGRPANNWYGINLMPGESYDIPEHLEHKVKSSPQWTVPRKKAVKKRGD